MPEAMWSYGPRVTLTRRQRAVWTVRNAVDGWLMRSARVRARRERKYAA